MNLRKICTCMVQLRNFFILENIESHLWLTLIIHSFQVNTLNISLGNLWEKQHR